MKKVVYQVGDLVDYGAHGVCRIIDFTQQTIDRKKKDFYVLEPLSQDGMRIYFPADNPAVLDKLRGLLDTEALHQFLSSDEIRECCWIEDENQRKQRYQELISSGDRISLLQMIHTLQEHKKVQLAQGRKFHLCDENFLRDAIKLLDAEFAVVLDIQPEDVGPYIMNELNK